MHVHFNKIKILKIKTITNNLHFLTPKLTQSIVLLLILHTKQTK